MVRRETSLISSMINIPIKMTKKTILAITEWNLQTKKKLKLEHQDKLLKI